MTVLAVVATILVLLPMALGLGKGGELQAPVASVVIGDLLTSTLVSTSTSRAWCRAAEA